MFVRALHKEEKAMSGIIVAMLVVGGVGLFIGLFLGIAAIKFKVKLY